MPRLNANEIDDYVDDREPRREVRKMKKKLLDSSPPKKATQQTQTPPRD